MSGFKSLMTNQVAVDVIFYDIKEKVLLCCDRMNGDLLRAEKKIDSNEPIIRDYLLENYLQNNSVRNLLEFTEFSFQPEVRERDSVKSRTKYGNIDIKILIKRLSFDDVKAYFIIECKRIDGTGTMNNKYVIDGVCRFVSKKSYYTTYKNRNFMLGFVVKDIDIDANAQSISETQNKLSDISVLQPFVRQNDDVYVYSSKYNHKSEIVELVHIFYDFSKVVGI